MIFSSTPLKKPLEPTPDPIEVLKKNVSDTLTFLHQERNDFLPEDDIIIPSRKDDHIANDIDLEYISLKTPKKSQEPAAQPEDVPEPSAPPLEEVAIEEPKSLVDETLTVTSLEEKSSEVLLTNNAQQSTPHVRKAPEISFQEHVEVNAFDQSPEHAFEESLRDVAEQEVEEVIRQAEDVVNDLQLNGDEFPEKGKEIKFTVEERADSILDDIRTNTEDSLDNLESLKDDSISAIQEKSEEAFKFLENEASSPLLSKMSVSEDVFKPSPLDESAPFIQKEADSELKSEDSSLSIESQSADSLSPVSPRSSIPLPKARKGKDKKKKGKGKSAEGKRIYTM